MDKIAKLSRFTRRIFQLIRIALPLFVAYFWLTVESSYDILTNSGLINLSLNFDSLGDSPLTVGIRLALTLLSLAVTAVPVYALAKLIRLFRNYEQGDIFSLENALIYRQLALSLFYWVIASVLYGAMISLIVTFNAPAGQHQLTLSIDDGQLLTLMLGLITLLISWVMKEAYQLSDDSKYTI
ncbi:DUF2975 domain-containing protein [Photobacterium sp. MCCC 1A19761]|uniref:DUF2975 domain-containing protein n=1 Tax=Photobacterium sp. MCCC 1A19761 TaxID=3115000 RepID=UPI00307D463C